MKTIKRWEGIDAFVKTVDCGSFSAASEELGVSKAHVSRQISALENRLGAQLLTRTTRSITVTEVGQAYYLRCRDLINSLDDAELAVQDLQQQPRGRLKISAVGAFAEKYVVPAAIEFMDQHKEMVIEVDFTNRIVDLVSEGFDLAIRSGVLKDSSLIARKLSSRNLSICASPEYFERHALPESIASLSSHNCLVGSNNTWRFKENGRHFDLRVDGNWRSNNGNALRQAALHGLGLAQLPQFYVQDDLEAGRLISVLDEFRPTDAAMWAVYPYNRHLSAKVRLFLNYLDQFLSSNLNHR